MVFCDSFGPTTSVLPGAKKAVGVVVTIRIGGLSVYPFDIFPNEATRFKYGKFREYDTHIIV